MKDSHGQTVQAREQRLEDALQLVKDWINHKSNPTLLEVAIVIDAALEREG
jgi:hypothetical protein